MGAKTEPSPSALVIHKVPHILQRLSWDCGVTCVMMLLDEDIRSQMYRDFELICREEGFGKSTWTIDLCYLLKRFNIKHCMYTTNMGVNTTYRRHKYYKYIIDKDQVRISRRFAEASSPDAPVTCRSYAVSHSELVQHLTRHGPVIVLVDNNLLTCDGCKLNKMKMVFRSCLSSPYSGHYILLTGYSPRAPCFFYLNPSRVCPSLSNYTPPSPAHCRLSPARLQEAMSSATDRDVIFTWLS